MRFNIRYEGRCLRPVRQLLSNGRVNAPLLQEHGTGEMEHGERDGGFLCLAIERLQKVV